MYVIDGQEKFMPSMVRKIYTILNRVSPTLAAIGAGWYSTIMGVRFDDLKRFFVSKQDSHSNIVSITRTLKIIENSQSQSRLAFVSPMPPADTGIASCSYYTFKGGEENIDIFFPPFSDEDFLLMTKLIGDKIRILDSSLLLYANEIIDYKKIIIAIGNSHHHFYLHSIFNKIKFLNIQNKCVLYIHDPYLNNFFQNGLHLSNSEYVEFLTPIYKLKNKTVAELITQSTKWGLHKKLNELNISGIKLLIELGFYEFLVNSEAAKSIIKSDCNDDKISIKKIFHPIFNASDIYNESLFKNTTQMKYIQNEKKYILIGTFGIPSYAKCTEIIIEAISELHKYHLPTYLLIAGYGVNKFFINNPGLMKKFIINIDSPSDASLNKFMHEVDIAVQLRQTHQGESSGVVPQLLAAKKKVICSPLGSFLEFGDAVSYFNGNSPIDLAKLLIEIIKSPINLKNINNYCLHKSPSDFRQAIIEYYR